MPDFHERKRLRIFVTLTLFFVVSLSTVTIVVNNLGLSFNPQSFAKLILEGGTGDTGVTERSESLSASREAREERERLTNQRTGTSTQTSGTVPGEGGTTPGATVGECGGGLSTQACFCSTSNCYYNDASGNTYKFGYDPNDPAFGKIVDILSKSGSYGNNTQITVNQTDLTYILGVLSPSTFDTSKTIAPELLISPPGSVTYLPPIQAIPKSFEECLKSGLTRYECQDYQSEIALYNVQQKIQELTAQKELLLNPTEVYNQTYDGCIRAGNSASFCNEQALREVGNIPTNIALTDQGINYLQNPPKSTGDLVTDCIASGKSYKDCAAQVEVKTGGQFLTGEVGQKNVSYTQNLSDIYVPFTGSTSPQTQAEQNYIPSNATTFAPFYLNQALDYYKSRSLNASYTQTPTTVGLTYPQDSLLLHQIPDTYIASSNQLQNQTNIITKNIITQLPDTYFKMNSINTYQPIIISSRKPNNFIDPSSINTLLPDTYYRYNNSQTHENIYGFNSRDKSLPPRSITYLTEFQTPETINSVVQTTNAPENESLSDIQYVKVVIYNVNGMSPIMNETQYWGRQMLFQYHNTDIPNYINDAQTLTKELSRILGNILNINYNLDIVIVNGQPPNYWDPASHNYLFDYSTFFNQYLSNRNYNEAWVWDAGYGHAWENVFIGTSDKFYPIMALNQTLPIDMALETSSHRFEDAVYSSNDFNLDIKNNFYNLVYNDIPYFIPGGGDRIISQQPTGIGGVHYPANARYAYDYYSPIEVNIPGESVHNCELWNCNGADYFKWWLNRVGQNQSWVELFRHPKQTGGN